MPPDTPRPLPQGTSAEATPRTAEFSASGTVITTPGFLAAYEEGQDEPADLVAVPLVPASRSVCRIWSEGQGLNGSEITADGHETTPPPRYTEASIVAELEA